MIEKSKERNILLVDDEPDITTIMSKGMQSHGFNVDTFTDPASALSEFKPSYYDMHKRIAFHRRGFYEYKARMDRTV